MLLCCALLQGTAESSYLKNWEKVPLPTWGQQNEAAPAQAADAETGQSASAPPPGTTSASGTSRPEVALLPQLRGPPGLLPPPAKVTAAPARAEPLEAHSLPAAQQQQPELPLRMADGLPAVVQHPPQQQQPQQQRPLGPAAGLLAGLPAPVQQQSCTATADVIKAMRSQGGLKEVSQQELQRLPSHVSKEQQAALLAGGVSAVVTAQGSCARCISPSTCPTVVSC